MNDVAIIAAILTLGFIPLFRVVGVFGLIEAKENAFITIVALAFVALLAMGILPAIDGFSYMFLLFVVYASVSIMWADHVHIAKKEIVRVAAVFGFYLLCRMIPSGDLLLLCCFIPAIPVTLLGMSQQLLKKDFADKRFQEISWMQKRTRFWAFFGNSNYSGAFLVPQAFIGLYLSLNMSPWLGFPTGLIVYGIYLTQARAALLALGVGAFVIQPWLATVVVPAAILYYRKNPGCMESVWHRFLMTRACFEMWKRWPIFGCGPRCFRHKHSRAVGHLNHKDPTILGTPQESGRYQHTVGRRAHNDFAESLAEYGVLGCTLFGAFLVLLMVKAFGGDRLLFAGMVACLINATLFLSFRDVAVSLPFFVIAGAVSGPVNTSLRVPMHLAAPAILIIIYLVYQFAYKPFMANYYAEQKGNIVKAMELQPFTTEWLYRIAIEAINQRSFALAFNCAEKALFYYDGERPEYSVLHTFGTICMAAGAFDVGEKAVEQALLHNPSSPEIFATLKQIRAIKEKQDEVLKKEQLKNGGKQDPTPAKVHAQDYPKGAAQAATG